MFHVPARQVHLDFHTSELMPGVGSRFNEAQFQKALQAGHVNSITVFAKCHHSWSYYPTEVGRMHPALDYDLTGAMVKAAHAIGVKAPVYLTVGWSANDAEAHPEWVARKKDGSVHTENYDLTAKPEDKKPAVSWKYLCPGGGYGELIYAHLRELCAMYESLDGLFLDINFQPVCYCEACLKGMALIGLDPEDSQDAEKYNEIKWLRFMEECSGILHAKHKEASFCLNDGASIARPWRQSFHTHFEREDLPATCGGYDLPIHTKYFAKTGRDFVAMTGKFHTHWGEFGGYKPGPALRYECALIAAYGAKCKIGDQMHPDGEMDMESYRLIGEAYEYLEKIEPYCYEAEATSRLGVMLSNDEDTDSGVSRILLEKQLDYDIVFEKENLDRYDVLILPDSVLADEAEASRLDAFVKNGGGLLLTGKSGLDKGLRRFLPDLGIEYTGSPLYENDYVEMGGRLSQGLVKTPLLFYEGGERAALRDAEELAAVYEPYFDRTYGHYCSHQNTPYKRQRAPQPGAVRKNRTVWLAHPVCRIYQKYGAQFHRDYFINALKLIYSDPVMTAAMPSGGKAHFTRQPLQNRYVLHLLYASPVVRGSMMVVEDLPPLFDVPVSVKIKETLKRVTLQHQDIELPFSTREGRTTVRVPRVECHQIVVFEY